MDFQTAEKFLLSLHQITRPEYLVDRVHPQHFLARMQRLLDILENPERRIPHYIHVGGTSGKGSVCLMLESIWRARPKGYSSGRAGRQSVGLFTSPGLAGPSSHFKVNGKPIRQKLFAAGVATLKTALEEYLKRCPTDLPSYFEVLTALGLLLFAEQGVNWAILEVGLGGKYDSTNIIPHKDAAVITNIGLDHTAVLGKTKPLIALQKAGIITMPTLVFTSERSPLIRQIFLTECQKVGARLTVVAPPRRSILYALDSRLPEAMLQLRAGFRGNDTVQSEHQLVNADLARAVAEALGIAPSVIRRGLSTVRLPLRLEIMARRPLIIVDGAHNQDKMKTTVAGIQELRLKSAMKHGKLYMIVGFAGDKALEPMIKSLAGLKPAAIACTRFTKETHRQAANPGRIYALAQRFMPGVSKKIWLDPVEALNFMLKKLSAEDTLLITGSLFLASELLPPLLTSPPQSFDGARRAGEGTNGYNPTSV